MAPEFDGIDEDAGAVENGEHGETREVFGGLAESFNVKLRHGLEKVECQVGFHAGGDCELSLIGQEEVAVERGDDGGSGCSRMVWSGSRMHGRIERDVAGSEEEVCGRHG